MITEAQYEQMKRRVEKKPTLFTPVTDEIAELHGPIMEFCKIRNWPCFHSDPTKATGRTPGEPDFIIALPDGGLLLLECKTATGQLTKEQSALRNRLAELGHYVHIIRSMGEFADALSKTLFKE